MACLALLLPSRRRLHGSPLSAPLGRPERACILLLVFTALVVLSAQIDPEGEAAAWRIGLEYGGDAGLLILLLLPAGRDRARGWGRAGFGRLPARAVLWLLVLLGGVAVFRIVLLRYVPCQCPVLDPAEVGWPRVAAFASYAGLLAPLTEEVLYRGIALPLLAERLTGWGGVLISAVAWAMSHGETPMLPIVVLGIALGWLTLATGSLWASIGFHAVWNGTVVGYEVYDQAVGIANGGSVPTPVIFLAVVALMLGWARLLDTARAGGIRLASLPDDFTER